MALSDHFISYLKVFNGEILWTYVCIPPQGTGQRVCRDEMKTLVLARLFPSLSFIIGFSPFPVCFMDSRCAVGKELEPGFFKALSLLLIKNIFNNL